MVDSAISMNKEFDPKNYQGLLPSLKSKFEACLKNSCFGPKMLILKAVTECKETRTFCLICGLDGYLPLAQSI
jgi:hypothetical protein